MRRREHLLADVDHLLAVGEHQRHQRVDRQEAAVDLDQLAALERAERELDARRSIGPLLWAQYQAVVAAIAFSPGPCGGSVALRASALDRLDDVGRGDAERDQRPAERVEG